MGTPNYPDDWADQWNRMRTGLQAAMTAARARVKYARIAAAEILVGEQPGRRIVVNPEGAATPSIRFYPEGVPENYAEILGSADPDSPGFTRMLLNTMTQAPHTQLLIDKDQFRATMRDERGTVNGGTLELNRNAVNVGFVSTATQSRMQFQANGVTAHYGRWSNTGLTNSQTGIFAGQVLQGSGSGSTWTDLAIGYGVTMASPMVAVATIKNTGAQAPFAHYVTAESVTGFTMRVEGSHAFYANFWCFRT
ncbi:hypothetical protein [Actinomadura macrotermitis]|uniref:Uncharacterized protein n=1 Tax=Actinomadura macrotermitis TaxID=2585200 RepID=A0A7K0C2N7_9ACTN|nr:hypothetical protein [Actinomadura macrotermitis]MQY07747.1 hypothetical protein [Actinomadura macrotermitis]